MPKRAIVLVVALLTALPAEAPARGELPLGHAGLHEARTTDVLARGMTYTRIERGRFSASDSWAVDVAVVADRAAAEDLAGRLRAAGFEAALAALPRPPDDRARGPLGYRVRSGASSPGATRTPGSPSSAPPGSPSVARCSPRRTAGRQAARGSCTS